MGCLVGRFGYKEEKNQCSRQFETKGLVGLKWVEKCKCHRFEEGFLDHFCFLFDAAERRLCIDGATKKGTFVFYYSSNTARW